MPTLPRLARLITIPFSHYCEKARWGLDHARVPYREEAYLPGMHMLPTRRAGGRTVPVLVTAERTLTDSADILIHCDALAAADRKLYPSEPAAKKEVDELEALCNGDLGVSSRLFCYHHTLTNAGALVDVVRPALTPMQAFFLPFAIPLVRPRIRRMYRVNEANAAEALEKTRRVFAELGRRLGGRRWLVGDRLTAADVTFASLAAPLLLPEGHPAYAPKADGLEGPLGAIVRELRATAAGQHALRLYREERRAGQARH